MQRFGRELIHTHAVGAEWPSFCGTVTLGEPFVIETEEVGPNGPIEVAGIRRGDVLRVTVERIEMEPPFYAPQSGPFLLGCGERVPLRYEEGWFYWPEHFQLQARPSVGNLAMLPAPDEETRELCRYQCFGPRPLNPNPRGWRRVVRDTRGKHCHQDSAALTAGACIYLRAQVDGAGLCVDDLHGYIGQGELGFGAIEVSGAVQLRVERSDRWDVEWPVIETDDEVLVVISYTATYVRRRPERYVDLVKAAYAEMRRLVATRLGISVEEANSLVSAACDIRNNALYGLGEGYIPQDRDRPPYDLSISAALLKSAFPA